MRWRARYRGPDGRVHSRSFIRKVDAQRWLREEIGRIDRGLWLDPSAGAISYRDWSEGWLATKHELSRRTRFDYEELLRTRVFPTFGPVELRRITPLMVREWIGQMADDGLSGARITKARHLLRSSLEMAVTDGIIWRNPTSGVEAPTARAREQRFLTASEVSDLADAVDRRRDTTQSGGRRSYNDQRDGAGLLVSWLAYTGMRWGEVVALRRSSIDAVRRRVRVLEAASEIRGELVVGPTKTHEARSVAMPAFLAERLTGAPCPCRRRCRSRVRFPERRLPPKLELALPSVATGPEGHGNRSGIANPRSPAHGSVADDRIGCVDQVVQRQLGHATASMTLDVYGHLYDDDLDALADALDRRFVGS